MQVAAERALQVAQAQAQQSVEEAQRQARELSQQNKHLHDELEKLTAQQTSGAVMSDGAPCIPPSHVHSTHNVSSASPHRHSP